MRAPTRMPPRALRAPGASRREPASRTSTGAIAALGPACSARGACAREMVPSEAKARGAAWMFGCWMFGCPPLLAAPAAGRLWGGMGVEAPMPRELTRRGCPSGAAQQQSEFHGAPRNRPDAGLPLRTAKGSQTGGRPFFGDFLSATRKKVTRTPGDSRPPPSTQACRSNQRTSLPQLRQTQPEQMVLIRTAKTIATSA